MLPEMVNSKTGVYRGKHYFFLFLLKNIDCGYSFEPPRLTSTHNLCFEQKYKKYQSFFLSENFQFLEVFFYIYTVDSRYLELQGTL